MKTFFRFLSIVTVIFAYLCILTTIIVGNIQDQTDEFRIGFLFIGLLFSTITAACPAWWYQT